VSLSRYRVIAEIAQAISSSTDYEVVLASVAEQAATAFDLSECCIYEYASDAFTAVPLAIWSRDPDPENETFLGIPLPLAEEPAMQRVMREREMMNTRIDDPLLPVADRLWMEKWNEMSTLYVPLVFGNEAIGCLELIEKRYVRPFTDYDHEFAATIAALAAMAIDSARTQQVEAFQRRKLEALLAASREVSSAIDSGSVLTTVARTTAEALEADACYIHLFDPGRDAIVWQATWERYDWLDDPDEGIGTVYPLDEHPYDREAMTTGRLIVQNRSDSGIPDDMRGNLDDWKLETFLTVPTIFQGRALGILEVGQAGHERCFTDDELELARALGEQAAAILQRRAPEPTAALS
jgi:GAF domain-containing protein